jgi:enoyl-CoA hydratase/carnithine racemase
MPDDPYACLRLSIAGGIARVTIDHPPINLLDAAMMKELARLGRELAVAENVRVVVVDSADADFFIAHADVARLQSYPLEVPQRPERLNGLHRVFETWRTMPKATIAQIAGFARGGGSEFALSLDMRFAALGKAVLGQPETALGIFPGGTGSQRLPQLVGRGRALEAILGAGDFPADVAERYGWVNRALPPDELDPFVDALAQRIASFPPYAIAKAKEAVDAALPDPVEGLLTETYLWEQAFLGPETKARMERFFAIGGQTPERERDWEALALDLAGTEA